MAINKSTTNIAILHAESVIFESRHTSVVLTIIHSEDAMKKRYLLSGFTIREDTHRRTGISQARLSQLSSNETTKLRADELYKIALAIDVDPCEILKELFNDIQLDED